MTHLPLSPLLVLLPALAFGAPAAAQKADAPGGPDLSGTIPILEERFADGLDRFDGRRGIWSTLPRRDVLMTNAAQTVFLDRGVLGAEVALPELHAVTGDGLSLRTARLPEAALPALRAYMARTRQGDRAGDVLYATGQINTSRTWAQAYGYFEIEARVPRGRGRWPAFWLTFAGRGWPPEIDVMEAYGEGIAEPTGSDGSFNTAVLFDAYDERDAPVHEVAILNPHDGGAAPEVKTRGGREVFTLGRRARDPGADIYASVNTYAAMWTPDEIVFYFGPDRDSLREIYRAPTPDDVHEPMYLIANDQFTARGGWWPADAALEAVLDPENDFLIRSITLRALEPELVLDLGAGDDDRASGGDDDRASVVLGTDGDDVIAPGDGFDLLRLGGGADEVRIARGRHNKIVEGFGDDDLLVLEGFPFADAADAVARLTQVGGDVWLTAPADPFWPQTIVLRGIAAGDLSPDQVEIR